jgi:WD40 repeat protein
VGFGASNVEILQLKGHGSPIQTVVFSPDGGRIATGASDRSARIWDATNQRSRATGHQSDLEPGIHLTPAPPCTQGGQGVNDARARDTAWSPVEPAANDAYLRNIWCQTRNTTHMQ